jgi:hypothetical protein
MTNDREVEINLRIPNLVVTSQAGAPQTINNAEFRFVKQMMLDRIPQADEALNLTIMNGPSFDARVVRVKWDDNKNRFVLDCRWAARGIAALDYQAMRADPDWIMKALLE